MKTISTMLAALLVVPHLAFAADAAVALPPESQPAPQSLPVAAPAQPALPFADGEKLQYEVSLLGLTAGQAELRVEESGEGKWRLHAYGRTVGASDSIFGLRQSASCTVQGDDLAPQVCLFTSQQRSEMKRREVRFDAKTGDVLERRVEDGKRSEKKRNFKGGVQDALSGLFLLRKNMPAQGETMSFRAMRKGKAITVEATAVGEEMVKTEAGAFLATVVDLKIITKVDKDAATSARVWFSADERRLPVKLSLAAPVGSLVAELTAAAGTLGNPLAKR
jgi:hypothetical protein